MLITLRLIVYKKDVIFILRAYLFAVIKKKVPQNRDLFKKFFNKWIPQDCIYIKFSFTRFIEREINS